VVVSHGHLLAGRVQYSQPANGFRSGIEPVLLAASIAARLGERVLEAGTGAGAALLCLTARVPGVHAVGVEIDRAVAQLAAANALANGFAGIEIIAGAVEDFGPAQPFDHAMANPPYHSADGTASPVAEREIAKRGSVALLGTWVGQLSRCLRHHGSLTLILPGGMVPASLSAMTEHDCACTVMFPLWPKAGRAAKLLLLRGVKHARTPMQVMPGLVLHEPDGSFTPAARAVLNQSAALTLDRDRRT
jgi:tRNA1Val (adenine37-N6)-methyltransferase